MEITQGTDFQIVVPEKCPQSVRIFSTPLPIPGVTRAFVKVLLLGCKGEWTVVEYIPPILCLFTSSPLKDTLSTSPRTASVLRVLLAVGAMSLKEVEVGPPASGVIGTRCLFRALWASRVHHPLGVLCLVLLPEIPNDPGNCHPSKGE